MARFIFVLDKIVNLYLYFVVMACFLGCVPNINPNYPLFHYIFKFAGFYLVPPFWGISLSPAIVMVIAALISVGLRKIYNKYFEKEKPQVIVLSPEDFMKKIVKNDDNDNGNDNEGKDDVND